MAWSSMHFAVGMACTGACAAAGCSITRRGWRWIPPLMTLGGIWACVPDMPRFWREDFPSLPFAATLGSINLEHFLHHWGNIFFFHAALDDQNKPFALIGLFGVLLLYNLSIAMLLILEHRQRQLRRLPLLPPPLRTPHGINAVRAVGTYPKPVGDPEDFDVQRLIHPIDERRSA